MAPKKELIADMGIEMAYFDHADQLESQHVVLWAFIYMKQTSLILNGP